MRRFLLAAMMFGTAAGAQAADMPDFLHGSLLPSGLHRLSTGRDFTSAARAAVGESDMNFTGATQSVVAKLLVGYSRGASAPSQSGRWEARSRSRHRLRRFCRLQQPMGQRRFRPRVQLSARQIRRLRNPTAWLAPSATAWVAPTHITYQSSASIGDFRTWGRSAPAPVMRSDRSCLICSAGWRVGQADIVRTATISGTHDRCALRHHLHRDGRDNTAHLIYGYSGGTLVST